MSNVHLIIKKTVIQARKLGRGAARSQWKKPRVPQGFPPSLFVRNRSIEHMKFLFFFPTILNFPSRSFLDRILLPKIGEWKCRELEGIDKSRRSKESRDDAILYGKQESQIIEESVRKENECRVIFLFTLKSTHNYIRPISESESSYDRLPRHSNWTTFRGGARRYARNARRSIVRRVSHAETNGRVRSTRLTQNSRLVLNVSSTVTRHVYF